MARIMYWFDVYVHYNEQRPHSSLGYLSPNEYERTIRSAEPKLIPERGSVEGFVCSYEPIARQRNTNTRINQMTEL